MIPPYHTYKITIILHCCCFAHEFATPRTTELSQAQKCSDPNEKRYSVYAPTFFGVLRYMYYKYFGHVSTGD